MTPERLRAYVVILTGDVAPVVAGFLLILAPPGGMFEAWMAPLVAAALGVPLVRPRNGSAE
jgi:hypothetical protein